MGSSPIGVTASVDCKNPELSSPLLRKGFLLAAVTDILTIEHVVPNRWSMKHGETWRNMADKSGRFLRDYCAFRYRKRYI